MLVVDDDRAMASSLTWGLETEGYVVDVAHDGEDGLWKAREPVLEYLMRRQGRVVSKTELLEHCWDPAYDGGPAVVEVLIHRLRRRLP